MSLHLQNQRISNHYKSIQPNEQTHVKSKCHVISKTGSDSLITQAEPKLKLIVPKNKTRLKLV